MPDTRLSPVTMWAIMIAAFCIVVLGATAIAPAFTDTQQEEGIGALLQKPFDDPNNVGNSVQTFLVAMGGALVLGLLIGGFIRWILKKKIQIAVRVIVAACLFLILSTTFAAIATTLLGSQASLWPVLVVALALAVAQYVYPEYWVIDVISILAAVGISALIGSSLGLLPAIILLALFSIYDFVAVLCSGWMKNMAQGSADLKLPSMFILPYDLSTSYRSTTIMMGNQKKNFMILGTGDFIFPAVLAVASVQVLHSTTILGTILLGILAAYTLMFLMLKFYPAKIQLLPGLPFLCSGAVLGLVIPSIILGVSWI